MRAFFDTLDRLSGVALFLDEDERSRARLVAWLIPLDVLVSLLTMLALALNGQPAKAFVSGVGVVVALLLGALWHWKHSLVLTAHAVCGGLLAVFSGTLVLTQDVTVLAWLAFLPPLALFLAGTRVGLGWLLVTVAVAAACVLWLLSPAAMLSPPVKGESLFSLALLLPVNSVVALFFQLSRAKAMRSTVQARERAEQANLSKSRFLAAISHEIRTPLNGILGTTEVILSGEPVSPELRDQLKIIQDSGMTLIALINDLLDLSKAEAGRLELVPQPFSPRLAVQEVLSLHRARASAKGLALVGSCEQPDGLLLLSDSVRIRQVLHNLVGNAVKFTTTGEVRVLSLVTPVRTGRWRLVLKVSDTGRGLAPADLERIFHPFTQARASDAHSGTGLGLAISRTLIEQMGGRLEVASELDRGSTFTVSFEFDEAQAQDFSSLGLPAAPASVAPREGLVLVVDDNPVNVKVAVGMLRRLGARAESVGGGLAALEALTQKSYSLVLMDLQMPDLDGAETTRRFRALPSVRRTPVVALTASALTEELASCLAAGMDDCLTKPLQLKNLERILDVWLPARPD